VQVGARAVPELARKRRPAALLQLLALTPGHRLHREEVLDLLWPELEPEAAANNLYGALHALRQVLEPERARGRPSAYLSLRDDLLRLHAPGALWIDVEAFELASAIARGTGDPAAYEATRELYVGDLLPEDRAADWTAARREALRGEYLGLLLELATLYEQADEAWAAIRTLAWVVAAEPVHEEAHLRLMRLYARVGQRQRALQQYRELEQALRRELDATPDVLSQRLYQDIRAGRLRSAGPTVAAPPPAWAMRPLAPREDEVARLIAQGRSNREIAGLLGLSPRTVETHVGRILRKLGLASRDQVAAWATQPTGGHPRSSGG
jgi:DNA-binding SARP family transcriptional activator/DNA-binding CsgD family transcriptional regulator